MDTTNDTPKIKVEVLHSPSLYLKEFEATEELSIHQRRLLSGTRLKAVLAPLMYWAIRHVPRWLALLPVRLLSIVLRLLYAWRANPFRQSCEYICRLSGGAGYIHQPKVVYGQLLKNALGTVENFFQLY